MLNIPDVRRAREYSQGMMLPVRARALADTRERARYDAEIRKLRKQIKNCREFRIYTYHPLYVNNVNWVPRRRVMLVQCTLVRGTLNW